uniref:G_PROTEIN_RECEP_F3_4 domain-containing protein n=1 Tax=Rhabditophanes sp. KR3021 TaxID=114890 RepID=A0AC35TYQ0_9BILA
MKSVIQNIISTIYIFTIIYINGVDGSKPKDLCSVYDPFRILPEDNKYQIGGAFPLHEPDCETLRPSTVQDIVAIQWALSHWNQNPLNSECKIGLYAGDSCSRDKETISQSLRFLDSVGYHEPKECETSSTENSSTSLEKEEKTATKLIALFAPKDANASTALANIIKTTTLPVGAYSTASVNALINKEVPFIIATAPPISTFIDVFVKIMASLKSNLVTIVDNNDSLTLRKVLDQLKSNNIYVAEVIAYNHPALKKVFKETDSKIILSLLPKETLITTLHDSDIVSMAKLWIAIPMDSHQVGKNDFPLIDTNSNLQVMYIQKRSNKFDNFKAYFLKVVKNNFESYSLLVNYLQQVHNCVFEDETTPNKFFNNQQVPTNCSSLKIDEMVSAYKASDTLENAIYLTYALAGVSRSIEQKPSLKDACKSASIACSKAILNELISLRYDFGVNDPIEFTGLSLSFYTPPYEKEMVLAANQIIDTLLIRPDFTLSATSQATVRFEKICEYETGQTVRWQIGNLKNKFSHDIQSICLPFRSYCGQCKHTVQVPENRYFLSIPKNYPLYIVGIFDFHYGNDCKTLKKTTDISLPMTFVHTAWTFRQRYPQMKLLRHIDFGALVTDGCSSGKEAINFVVQSESYCYNFEQANRNITVVPGSTFGYIAGVSAENQVALQHYFSDSANEAPMVSIDGEHNALKRVFTTMPSNRNLAIVILRYLRKMRWEFVSVVLSEQDHDSLSSFKQFERMANDRGICIAEVINVNSNGGENAYVHGTNITLMFTTAKDASIYLNGRLKRGLGSNSGGNNNIVHVMIGDAHNFHLFDSTNLINFVGTVSIQPQDVLYPDFRQWLEMITPLTLPEQWYWTIVEERWQCALLRKNKDLYGGKMCSGEELLDVTRLGRMTKTGYLARGMERLLFAMDNVYNKLCPEQQGICPAFLENGRKQVLQILLNTPVEDHFEIYEFLPKDDVKSGGLEFKRIGNWSMESGLRMQTYYKTFINGEHQSSVHHISQCLPPLCKCFLDSTNFLLEPLNHANLEEPSIQHNKMTFNSLLGVNSYIEQDSTFVSGNTVGYSSAIEHLMKGNWRKNSINYVIIFINTVLLISAIGILMLVIIKMYLRVVKGNQSLGIILLVGIICIYITAYFFIFDATDTICRYRMIMHGFSYTICFGVMIAKATQLKNAESLGFSSTGHISYWNYWQLLFFIVLVQIALSIRWISEPFASSILIDATSSDVDTGTMVCSFGSNEFVVSQAYVIILLILTLFINTQNKNIKRNYKETKWLFAASLVCVVVWIGWIGTFYVVNDAYKSYVVIFELIFCATILLAFLFGPKIYILLSYEPVVVECQPSSDGSDSRYGDHPNELFEKDCEFAMRSGSPSSVSETGSCKSVNFETRVTSFAKSNSSGSGTLSDEESDKGIFQTEIRKKKSHDGNSLKKV